MRSIRLLPIVALLAAPWSVCPAEALRIYTSGDVTHTGPTPYVNHWGGTIEAEIGSSQGATLLTLPLAHGGLACRLFASWRTTTGTAASTLPMEICLSNDQVTSAELATWLAGGGSIDPTLGILLAPGTAGELVNAGTVSGQAFLRGCGGTNATFQRYASLTAAPGTIHLLPATDPGGNPVLSFAVTSLQVSNVSPAAWLAVHKACGGKAAELPSTAVDGQSINLAGSSLAPAEGPGPAPLAHVQQAENAVAALGTAAVLTRGQQKSLVAKLDQTRTELRRAAILKSVKRLQKLKGKTEGLLGAGLLTAQQAATILLPAERAQEQCFALEVAGRTRAAIGTCAPPPCEYPDDYVIYRVSTASKRPPGAPPIDFNNVGAALDAAAGLGVCGVEVVLEPGTYAGNQVITRDTRLSGEDRARVILTGSIVNLEDVRLRINRVTLRSIGAFGAVHVDSPCAETTLSGIDIDEALLYGVRHEGGALRLVDTTVEGTRTEGGSLRAGTGVYLTGGVRAVIADSQLGRNGAAALVAEGAGTRVHVSLTTVDRSLTTPHFDPTEPLGDGFAAVEVLDEALLLMEFSQVSRSELLGLYVHSGAQGHVRDSVFSRTATRPGAGGGHNFFARGATFELTRITTSSADLSGAFIGAVSIGGIVQGTFVTGTDWQVRNNRIGIHVDTTPPDEDPKYHPELCIAPVEFDGNEDDVNLQPLPLPCGAAVTPTCPPSSCRTVPFDCTWCEDG